MKYRVYLNCFEDMPLVWQVDEGSRDTARRVKLVVLIHTIGITKYNLERDNVDEPKCWIEVRGDLDVADDVAIIRGSHV